MHILFYNQAFWNSNINTHFYWRLEKNILKSTGRCLASYKTIYVTVYTINCESRVQSCLQRCSPKSWQCHFHPSLRVWYTWDHIHSTSFSKHDRLNYCLRILTRIKLFHKSYDCQRSFVWGVAFSSASYFSQETSGFSLTFLINSMRLCCEILQT